MEAFCGLLLRCAPAVPSCGRGIFVLAQSAGKGFPTRAVEGCRAPGRGAWAPPAVRGTGMEPTESAVPGSRLRLRRMAVAWRAVRGVGRPAGRPGAEVRAVGQYTAEGRAL
ncbi:hypothetical protein, partial [Streptomyces violarus]|uniref:hypothetical protein n=1 Tax=Streptomyces violarus TaxID=67380 RepID=UPI00370384DA